MPAGMTLDEFEAAWERFVAGWLRTRKRGRRSTDPVLADLLDRGLEAAGPPGPPRRSPSAEDLLECEAALVRMSDLFDAAAYTAANQEVRSRRLDPAGHFAAKGWHLLRNPSLGFDVWWYWSEYLDPTRHDIDPLLHYLLVGRHRGYAPLPPVEERRPPTSYDEGRTPRRVCLFAAYDPHGVVDDTVVGYLRELSRHADVYFLSDGFVAPDELAKVAPCTKGAWSVPHGAYDFGSYSMLAKDLVGWDVLDRYDELLLVNDSAYLLRPLDDVFAEMDRRACDWWGLQATKHDFVHHSNGGRPLPLEDAKRRMIGERHMLDLEQLHISSYFLAFRKPVLADDGFRRRLDSVAPQTEKMVVVFKYEIGLSRYLMAKGFDFDTFVPDLHPFHPLYTEPYFDLLERGFPLLKRNFVSDNNKHVPGLADWKERILRAVPDAPVDLFERNLLRVSADDRLRRSFAVSRDESGKVDEHRPLSWWQFREEDRFAPKFDHWWAFPVSPTTHLLTGSQRAVFEEVREDPSVKKVVLTRSRGLPLDGENVLVLALTSAEGQEHLARSRHVFVPDTPRATVSYPLSAERHHFIHVGGVPVRRTVSPAVSAGELEAIEHDNARCHAVVASSKVQGLAAAAAFHPMPYDEIWVTGAPRNDLVLRAYDDLPADLREQETRLRGLVGDRRLVLVAPTYHRPGEPPGYALFSDDELDWLTKWCDRSDVVLGFRDDPADRARSLARRFGPLGGIDLALWEFPSLEVADRVASALLTDSSARALEFMVTGRPVVSLLREPEAGTTDDPDLFYELETVLTGPVVHDFDSFAGALEVLFEPAGPQRAAEYEWKRRLVHGRLDDRSAQRLVRRVRELYVGRPGDGDAG